MTPYTIQAILDSDPDRIGELKNEVISPNKGYMLIVPLNNLI